MHVLSCDTADQRYNLISSILLKVCLYGATEFGNVNRIGTAVAKVLYASNTINAIYLSSPCVEKSSFFSFSFALLRKAINVLVVLIQIQPTEIFWILFCQISTLISQLKKLFMMLKVLLIYKRFSIVKKTIIRVKNNQIFYTELLLQNTTFLPEYSFQKQMHFHQEESIFIHTLTAIPHSLHSSIKNCSGTVFD